MHGGTAFVDYFPGASAVDFQKHKHFSAACGQQGLRSSAKCALAQIIDVLTGFGSNRFAASLQLDCLVAVRYLVFE